MATFFTRGLAALGGVLLSLVVARLAGAEGLGRFAVFLSLLGLFAILARRGKEMLLMRAVAWADGKAILGTPLALLFYVGLRVVLPAIVLGGVGSGLLASGWLGKAFPGSVSVMPIALLLLTLLTLIAGYNKGVSRAWLAPLFEIGGVSMLAAVFLAIFTLNGPVEAETSITTAFWLALMVLCVISGVIIWYDMPQRLPLLDDEQKAEFHKGQLDFSLIVLATFLTKAGSFLLAAPFLSEVDLGLLRAAERLALLVSFPMLAINPIIAPGIVRLSRGGDAAGLRRLVLRAVTASSGIAACLLLPLLIFPDRALSLMGPEFSEAVPYLQIMALAQFLVAVTGPLAMLLNMSGRERASMWINIFSLATAIVLIPYLSILRGAQGFAAAYCVVIFGRVFFLAVFSQLPRIHSFRKT